MVVLGGGVISYERGTPVLPQPCPVNTKPHPRATEKGQLTVHVLFGVDVLQNF